MRLGRNRKIVVLCGSTRFVDAYIKANKDETLAGNIVLSVGMFGHQEGIDMEGQVKKDLDDLHLDKIDLAHEVLVLNVKDDICSGCKKRCETASYSTWPGRLWSKCCMASVESLPYIGESTRQEIAYAKQTGKPVRYLNPITE